ncbi:MAG: hypothetical protein M1822_001796 [Bathelium mastoideum]|nr:MAG: hypothetical protein M1822_001796 [Bathelium mastoideum]
MVLPFGISIGDFIAFIGVTIKAVNALKDSTASRKGYRDVIYELESLKRALAKVQNVEPVDMQTKALLERVVTDCGRLIQEFSNKIEKFNKSLGNHAGSRRILKDSLRKIQWVLYSKEDIRKLKQQLHSHTALLNTLLSAANYAINTARHEEQNETLIRIESKIDREYGKGNFQIPECALTYLKVSQQVCFDQPICFQDAHGRMLPIQMVWIDTWEHFETMLKWKFSDVPGLKKIERGEYVVCDTSGKKDIDRRQAIQSAFRPGRKIDMSMVFQRTLASQRCPKCEAEASLRLDVDNHWYGSYSEPMSFKRKPSTTPGTYDHLPRDVQRLPADSSGLRKCSNKTKTGEEVDAISDFTRVRIFELQVQDHDAAIIAEKSQIRTRLQSRDGGHAMHLWAGDDSYATTCTAASPASPADSFNNNTDDIYRHIAHTSPGQRHLEETIANETATQIQLGEITDWFSQNGF